VTEIADAPRDLSSLVVSQRGFLEASDDLFDPFRLVDASGTVLEPVSAYLRELQACGRSASTQRSYGMDLLRWFRFLWTVEVGWDQATRVEARDFCSWIQISDKPVRPHWRRAGEDVQPPSPRTQDVRGARAGGSNPVTGKAGPGVKYAAATAAHSETVLRSFYRDGAA